MQIHFILQIMADLQPGGKKKTAHAEAHAAGHGQALSLCEKTGEHFGSHLEPSSIHMC